MNAECKSTLDENLAMAESSVSRCRLFEASKLWHSDECETIERWLVSSDRLFVNGEHGGAYCEGGKELLLGLGEGVGLVQANTACTATAPVKAGRTYTVEIFRSTVQSVYLY